MKIVTVVGARPQFIKAAAINRLTQQRDDIEEVLVHTGQHYDEAMSGNFFVQLGIDTPKHHLQVGSSTHGAMTGRMLEKIEEVLITEKPDCVLVYGDTNSTLAGALAATKLGIRIAHVEAGLRSFNRSMPEETNRVLTDHCSDILFTPSGAAKKQLLNEGIAEEKIHVVGDVMVDVCHQFRKNSEPSGDRHVLVTVHRQENTDDPERMHSIVKALIALAEQNGIQLCWPMHPRTKKTLPEELMQAVMTVPKIEIIEPLGYCEMLANVEASSLVLTDSGGLQKEAYMLRRPCVTMRDETEWVELVEHGYNVVAGVKTEAIITSVLESLNREINWREGLYGDGKAATRILDVLQVSS